MQKQTNISEKLQTTWIKTYTNVRHGSKTDVTQFNPRPNHTEKDHDFMSITISADQDRYSHDSD
jgi:hypothetical protein